MIERGTTLRTEIKRCEIKEDNNKRYMRPRKFKTKDMTKRNRANNNRLSKCCDRHECGEVWWCDI
jgi:hypothetical protein